MGIEKRLLACFNSRFNASPEGESGGEPQQDGKGAGLGLMPHRLADNNGDGLTCARSVECRHSSLFFVVQTPSPQPRGFLERTNCCMMEGRKSFHCGCNLTGGRSRKWKVHFSKSDPLNAVVPVVGSPQPGSCRKLTCSGHRPHDRGYTTR